MTTCMQDETYVRWMSELPVLDVNSALAFLRRTYSDGPAHAFAENISSQQLAFGYCVVVNPPTYTPIQWSLDDFRDYLGLHGAGVVQVESKSPSHPYPIRHPQIGGSIFARTERTDGQPVYEGLPALFLGSRWPPCCSRHGYAQVHRVSRVKNRYRYD